jgi:phosphatidylglycerol:prolipoprotein diacylglycerol transferase
MHPVLFHYGFLTIHSYGLMMALGIILGAGLVLWLSRDRKMLGNLLLDFLPLAIIAGLVGARLWDAAFTWEAFADRPWELIWRGGLSVQGTIVGATLAGIWFCRRRKLSFRWFADTLSPGLILGQALGRSGCFLGGCCYGVPTQTVFGVRFPSQTDAFLAYGNQALWPTQLFEAGWNLLVLAALVFLSRRKHYSGAVFVAYLILYSGGRFLIEFLRGDSLHFFSFRSAQVAGLAAILIALALHFYWSRKKPVAESESQAIPSPR